MKWAVLGAVVAVVIGAFATYQRGMWGSYEHKLAAAVDGDCTRVRTTDDGRGRFDAICDNVGPQVTWVRYRDRGGFAQAVAAKHDREEGVCVSPARKETLVVWDVAPDRLSDLCRARDGRVVQPGRQP